MYFISNYFINDFSFSKKVDDEIRGVWIVTISRRNWPKTDGIIEQKREIISYLNLIKSIGINRVYFQVRDRADALYKSELWPWSSFLTGELGKDPGYDPLSFVKQECKKRNLVLEAWLNPFLLGSCENVDLQKYLEKLPKGNKLLENLNWIKKSEERYVIDLTNPEARQMVIDEAVFIAKKYNLPIHIDDYFFPYPIDNKLGINYDDSENFEKFGKDFLLIEDFRRDCVNDFIKNLHDSIKSINKDLTLSVSPFAIWKNDKNDGGSDTNGLESYYKLFCDTVFWVKNNYVDYIIPQVYWNVGHEKADYDKVVRWWDTVVKGTKVKLIIGQAGFLLNANSNIESFKKSDEIINQINLNRRLKNVSGQSIFSLQCLIDNSLNICERLKLIYSFETNGTKINKKSRNDIKKIKRNNK